MKRFALSVAMLAGCALLLPAQADPETRAAIAKIFGAIVDPDKDCVFTLKGTALVIQMTSPHHTLSTSPTRLNAPRTLRDVSGDFDATVRVEVVFPNDPKTDLADLDPGAGAGLLLWIDEKNYVTLERLHELLGKNMATSGMEFHSVVNGVEAGSEASPPAQLNTKPVYLKMEKRGEKIKAFASSDAVQWRPSGSITFEAKGKMKIGVFAGHNTSQIVTATLDQFEVKELK